MRYFIHFSYNGTRYHGWQIQPNAISVQETLNKALSLILQKDIFIHGAGRTDTGVHAKEMYAHFDVEEALNKSNLIYKLNAFLPHDLVIFDIFEVKAAFHSRFNAKKRTYEYHLHTYKNAFLENQSWYFQKKLNLELMNQAATKLLEHTDFEAFSKVHTDVGTFNCKIYEAFWTLHENQLVFTISADRFLRNMVRAIVGTLINVGLQKIDIQQFEAIIASKNRTKAGFSVPAHGLYLTKICYDFENNTL